MIVAIVKRLGDGADLRDLSRLLAEEGIMKLLALVAAALIGAAGISAGPASADTRVRVVERTHVRHSDHRRWHSGRRSAWRWRTSCHTQWRNGHRERVCRRIRYR